ncbi:MAG: DUF5317 domain-containing protein [Actinomycetota bacterium]|nr:DUF5317 domain-containing protein [Actinomycetota bacterium]
MFLVAFVGLAFLSVPLLGGSVTRLAEVRIAHIWAVMVSLALQIMVVTVMPDADPVGLAIVHVVSYLFAGYFLWANRRIPGVAIIAIGWAMNAIVISVNGGVMPATARAGDRGAGVADVFLNSRPLSSPRLSFLGDNFAMPATWPIHNVFSVGDVFIALGAFVALHWICGSLVARTFDRLLRPSAT